MASPDVIYWSSEDQLVLVEDLLYLYQEEEGWNTIHQIGQCVVGCLSSVKYTVGRLILFTIVQRFINLMSLPVLVKHISSIFLGLLVLLEWIQRVELSVSIILGNILLVLLLLLTIPHKGFTVMLASILLIVSLQCLVPVLDFMAVRGILMIFSMKISSLAFDKGHDFAFTDVIPAFTFMFSPSTMIFGPFHTYADFMNSMNRRTIREEVSSAALSIALLAVALCLLTYSSCIGIIVPQESLLTDYFVAQSFRSSHFFVCILSQGLSMLSGMRLSVCSPFKIEIPRSIVEVVTEWNIPMHRYLRSYVYLKFQFLGNAGSIFASFAVSSLLHGFNFQITAVLLTLGFICYFENKLRNRFASRFSMCVRARKCGRCNHKRNSVHWQTLFLNAVFSINAVYLLIYLGAPFGDNGAEIGYDMYHTISTWKRHRFAGHWIGIGIAVLSTYM